MEGSTTGRWAISVMNLDRTQEELDDERDAVWIEEFLARDGHDDAAVIATRKAGIMDPHFPIDVIARRTFNRLAPAIKLARKYYARRQPTEVTKDTLLADLENVFSSAVLTHDHAAANANRKLVAQLTGILREDVTITHRYDVKVLSDSDLEKIALRSLKSIDGQAVDITPGIGHMKLVGEVVTVEPDTPPGRGAGTSTSP